MKAYSGADAFEWDEGNFDKNFVKHGVTNQEAEEVFFNEPKLLFEDERHSQTEKRYLLLGATNRKRKLAIIFTIRDSRIRIISARDMHQKERKVYDEETKNHPAF